MAVMAFTEENFSQEVLQADKTVLVDFWASWCGPCMMMAPVIDEIAAERADIKVGKINVDEQPKLAGGFNIEVIPTIMVFKGGKAVGQTIGVKAKEEILQML